MNFLIPKQMIHRLTTTLPQVKEGSIYENLLHEIRKIIYFLYRANETTKLQYIEFNIIIMQK